MFNTQNRNFLTLGLIFGLVGCGEERSESGTLQFAMQVAAPSLMMTSSQNDIGILANDYTDTVSFTPTSFKIPIMKISLFKSDYTNEQVLYSCAGANEAACLVDLTSQAELDSIETATNDVAIEPDTYSYVVIATCSAGSTGMDTTTAKITGQAPTAIGANGIYRSSASATVVSGGAAEEAEVGNWGCGSKVVKLNPAVEINADSEETLTVLVDNTFLGYFGTNISGGMGGCKVNGGGSNGIGLCVNYPALLGYVGTGTPSIKRFKITHAKNSAVDLVDAKANAILMIAVATADKPVSAFGRPFFGDASAPIGRSTSDLPNGSYDVGSPLFAGPGWGNGLDLDTFIVAADGSVSFKLGGSLDLKGASVSNFVISALSTGGTVQTRDGVDTWFYRAIPMN